MTDCKHDIDETTCAICKRGVRPSGRVRRHADRTMTARFDGRCPCGEPIDAGDTIGVVDGD